MSPFDKKKCMGQEKKADLVKFLKGKKIDMNGAGFGKFSVVIHVGWLLHQSSFE